MPGAALEEHRCVALISGRKAEGRLLWAFLDCLLESPHEFTYADVFNRVPRSVIPLSVFIVRGGSEVTFRTRNFTPTWNESSVHPIEPGGPWRRVFAAGKGWSSDPETELACSQRSLALHFHSLC